MLRKFISASLIATILTTAAYAKNDEWADKITKLHSTITRGLLKYEAKKIKDGYTVYLIPTNAIYKQIFKKDASVNVKTDKGLITKQTLTANGTIAALLEEKVAKSLLKNFKDGIKFDYKGKVTFFNKLKENITIEPLEYKTKGGMKVKVSKTDINLNADLDKMIPSYKLDIESVLIDFSKKIDNNFALKGLSLSFEGTQPAVDGMILYGNSNLTIKHLLFKVKQSQKVIIGEGTLNVDGNINKVSEKFSKITFKEDFSTENVKTIALLKGIKEHKISFVLDNIGTKGFVEFMKLQESFDKMQSDMALAAQSGDNKKLQEAIAAMQETTNKIVPIFNNTFIGGKTKIKLDIELESDKSSFVKLDLLYKGEPIQGNVQSAFISLAAKGLALFDGDIEVKLDSTLASNIYPMASLVLGMLEGKGFVKKENGMYNLKATLKDGNIIINGKTYTMQELSKALF